MALKKQTKDEQHAAEVRARAERDRLRGGDDEPSRVSASPFSINSIRAGTFNSLIVKIIMGLLVFIFAIGFAFTALTPGPQGTPGTTGTGPIARVGSQTIARDNFEAMAAQQMNFMSQFGQNIGPAELMGLRQRTLQQLIERAALIQAANDSGIRASRAEIDAKIEEFIDEQVKMQQEQGEADFRRRIESQFGSMDEFRSQARASYDRDAVRDEILLEKLEKQIKDGNKVDEAAYKRSQTKLHLRQIVVRPKLPAPNAENAAAEQEKNAAEAKERADKLAAELKAKPSLEYFTQTAQDKSDDVVTKVKGGDIGWKLPSAASGSPEQLPYSQNVKDALVNAEGKVVGPVQDEMSQEYYIFFIENRAERLPEDYAKKKEEYLKTFEEQEDNQVWAQYQQEVRDKYEADIQDPALRAYKIQTESIFQAQPDQQDGLRNQAVELYQQALRNVSGPEADAVHFQMAQLYRDLKQPEKAVESLRAATQDAVQPSQADLDLVRTLRDTGKTDEALTKLNEVSKKLDEAPAAASPFGNPNDMLRGQVAIEYEALGKKDLAEKERAKIAPAGGMGGLGGFGGMDGGGITINPAQ